MKVSGLRYRCASCASVADIFAGPGGMSGENVLHCNRCGKATSVNVDDGRLARFEALFATREKAYAALSANLAACDCGGAFELSAPARCTQCHTPIDREAFRLQTGTIWRNHLLAPDTIAPRWRMICSFCGIEDGTVIHADTARHVYACAKCRSPDA